MDDCVDVLLSEEVQKKLFGDRTMPKELLKRFAEEIQAMKKAADNGSISYESKLHKFIENKKAEADIDKAVAANDLRLAKARMEYYKQEGFKTDPVEAFQAKITFSRRLGNDARYSAVAVANTITHVHLNALYGGVLKKGEKHWDAFTSGVYDLDIRRGVKELASGKQMSGDNQIAKDIAEVVYQANRKMYNEHLNSGVPLRDMPGWTASTMHDTGKLLQAGRDTWVAKMQTLKLDKERMFGKQAGDLDFEKKSLETIYDNITKANYAKKPETPFTDGQGLSYARKLTHSRSLHFLDADSEHAYHLDYGVGNFSELVIGGTMKKAKMLSLVKIFGANPEKALMGDVDNMIRHFESVGDITNADRLRRGKESIRETFLHMSGARDEAALNTAGKIGEMVRNNNVLAMLPWTGVRSVANFAGMAMQLHTVSGKNYFESLGDSVKAFAATIPPAERAKALERTGLFLQDMNSTVQQMGFGDSLRGNQGKAARLMFKLNGMEWMNKGLRAATSNEIMYIVADNIGKNLKDTHDMFHATMLSAGITDADFKILGHAVKEMPDGRKLVTTEGIEGMDPELVRARAEELKISATRYLTDLRDRYYSIMHMAGDVASTTAGPREQALIRGNSHKGTGMGELRMTVGQFKSFWAQSYNIFSAFKNSVPDPELLQKGIVASKGVNKNLAAFMLTATGLGYLGQAFIDMSRGRDIKDPRRIETWMDAFTKGGAGNMYGDILLPDYSWTGAGENLLGPTIGQIAGPMMKLRSEATKDLLDDKPGFQKTVKNQATRLIRNNIPLNQAPGLGQALDYLQFDLINESLSPGYSSKKRMKAEKEIREGKRIRNPLSGE